MAIYGTALLSGCLLVGVFFGRLLGNVVGVNKDVGGVGIAMLLLILACDWLRKRGRLVGSEKGITFWSFIYIPIVVAMAAKQDVVKAVQGGTVAIAAGVLVVLLCFSLVPLISRIGAPHDALPTDRVKESEP